MWAGNVPSPPANKLSIRVQKKKKRVTPQTSRVRFIRLISTKTTEEEEEEEEELGAVGLGRVQQQRGARGFVLEPQQLRDLLVVRVRVDHQNF